MVDDEMVDEMVDCLSHFISFVSHFSVISKSWCFNGTNLSQNDEKADIIDHDIVKW